MQRKLAAIFAADVVSYSRLMALDEANVLDRLKVLHRDLVKPLIEQFHGRIFKLMGDGLLAEFPSVVEAISCGVALQERMAAHEPGLAEDKRIRLRIGINLGDVLVDGTDLYGDGVNIASRLEALAEPGGVCVSGSAFDAVEGKLDVEFEDLGAKKVKNVPRPVRTYRLKMMAMQSRMPAPAETAPTLPDKPSIAVLPFDNMSGDAEQEYFADGVVEALTAALSRIRSFFVIARNSAFTYKGKAANVRDIGRNLGVAYVLQGSVQIAGNRVRIGVQLIETEAGAHVWADKYDGSLDDIFDLQDRITEQVAGALQPSIRLAEIERARRKRPQDLGAYDYTMRALRHVWMLEKQEAVRALELLGKAIEIDPDYPLALALAAWCHAQQSVYNWVDDPRAARAKSLALAERAADLSSDDPLILTVLGTVHTLSRNYGATKVLLERAVTLDPNAAWAWSRLGWLATYTDRPVEAQSHFERALRLSPVDPMNFNNYAGLGSSFLLEGRDNEAAEMFLRALDERPNALWIHRTLAPALLGAGREEEARRSYAALVAAYPSSTVEDFKKAMPLPPNVLDRIGNLLAQLGVPEC
jgi:adenylate cyclase